MGSRKVVALSGGGFSDEPDNTLLDDYILRLTGALRPRVCFLPTASGDADGYIDHFYAAFSVHRCVPSHATLFRPRGFDRHPGSVAELGNLRQHLLNQDVIYVGGGNTPVMLAAWRVHGVDRALRDAWDAGIVLCGISAGALCWFEAGTTDAFGRGTELLLDGLALLPGSYCPHYDSEPTRRPRFLQWIADSNLPPGYAADDRVALRFEGRQLAQVVSSKPGARAYAVGRNGTTATEVPIEATLLT